MENEEAIASGSEAGAGENAQSQEAESASQDAGQSQSSEGVQSKVDNASTDASSKKPAGRSNIDWALQRQIEKAVKKTLQSSLTEHLNPILEALKTAQSAPAVTANQADDQPDYNNLNEWISKRVNSLLQERLKAELPQTLNQFKGQVTSEVQSKARLQEARNYLISQSDVGRDQKKLDEIREVMEENMIDVDSDPVRAAEIAVKLWRQGKSNPNAPPKSHLSTISGGAGSSGQKRELTIQELKALQNKIAAGNLTMDEQEKLGKEIDSLVFA